MLGENDNLVAKFPEGFRPSKIALFLPIGIVAGGYACLLSWLLLTGSYGSGITRLAIVVLSVGVPFLVAHAVLRYFTIQIRTLPHALMLHTGFPRGEPYEIPYSLIRAIDIKRGIGGRIAGSGTLIFRLVTGQNITVCDLDNPKQARMEIERLVDTTGLPAQAEPDRISKTALQAAASDR